MSTNNNRDRSDGRTELVRTDGGRDGDNTSSTGPADEDVEVTPEGRIQGPKAKIDAPTSSIIAGEEVTLDGSGSKDPDGRITNYNWEVETPDGTSESGSGMKYTTTLSNPGTYNVRLTVEDNHGVRDTASTTVTAAKAKDGGDNGGDNRDNGDNDDDQQPDRTIVIDGTGADGARYEFTVSGDLEQVSGTLEGINVSDNPGDTVSGSTAEGQVYGGADGFRFSGDLQSRSFPPKDKVTVYVDGKQLRQSEKLTAKIDAECRGLSCDLSGADSTSADENITEYRWKLGDGTTKRGKSITHTYESGGGYTVTLTVEDESGDTDSATKTVTVRDPSGDADSLLSMAALVPTVVTRKNGKWVPKKKQRKTRSKAWEIAPVGKHWKDTNDSPPPWLQDYETQQGMHYLKIPCLVVISTSIDTSNTDQQIPWDPEIEVTNSNRLLGVEGDSGNDPGVHRRELIFEVPQTSASYLTHIGEVRLTLALGSGSQFYDEIDASGLIKSNKITLSTSNQYGLEYTHQAALGDALKTAYERLKRLHAITNFAFKGVTSIFTAAGATITMEVVAKEGGKQVAKQALKLSAKRVVTEAKQVLNSPSSSQLSTEDLEKARFIHGTALYTFNQGDDKIGFSGPMMTVRSE